MSCLSQFDNTMSCLWQFDNTISRSSQFDSASPAVQCKHWRHVVFVTDWLSVTRNAMQTLTPCGVCHSLTQRYQQCNANIDVMWCLSQFDSVSPAVQRKHWRHVEFVTVWLGVTSSAMQTLTPCGVCHSLTRCHQRCNAMQTLTNAMLADFLFQSLSRWNWMW